MDGVLASYFQRRAKVRAESRRRKSKLLLLLMLLQKYLKRRNRARELPVVVGPGFDVNADHDDITFKTWFRFTKPEILLMTSLFEIPEKLPLKYHCTGFQAMCVLLWRLTFPCRLVEGMQFFGKRYSPPKLSKIINYMFKYLYNRYLKLLFFDINRVVPKLATFASAISRRGSPLPNVWGFLDGTCREICRPSRLQRLVFSGHKRRHVLKFQSVVTPDGMIAHLGGPVEGRRTDSFMLHKTKLLEVIQATPGFGGYVLYADGGYGASQFLKKPNVAPAHGSAEQLFNTQMSTVRISVEWGFQLVTAQFKYLDYCKQQKVLLQPVAIYYAVGVLLTNCKTCLDSGNLTSKYFGLPPPLNSRVFKQ